MWLISDSQLLPQKLHVATGHLGEVMSGLLRSQSHIVVVDPRPQDYRDLAVLAATHGWHFHFLTSARAAIRFSRLSPAALWMINMSLPDMSGLDLLEMLRHTMAKTPMLIVADDYKPESEALACSRGAALFRCKGPGPSLDCKALLTSFVDKGPASVVAR